MDVHVADTIPLGDKVAFLRQPYAYAPRPKRVDAIETHMAWVFLTDSHAYKLKKPLRNSFRDFRAPAARKASCHEEIHLNRQLAPNVYLNVVPLVVDSAGRLALRCPIWTNRMCTKPLFTSRARDTVVDWLVKMRRLSAHLMLDHMLIHDHVSVHQARQIGATLARFHKQAKRIHMSVSAYEHRLSSDIHNTRLALAKPAYGLHPGLVNEVANRLQDALERLAPLFAARVRDGRIVEGHGDLRPEHVCLEPDPVIIDCIEFNEDLRVLDALSDLCFLVLECRRLGAESVGRHILDSYMEQAGDPADERLVRFYQAQHAYGRAKVAIWHLDDINVPHPARWLRKSIRYLRLALEYC